MRLLPLLFPALILSTIQPDQHRQASASPGMSPRDSRRSMDALWADLEKGETDAIRALLNLADLREDAVAFLRTKVKPLNITPGAVRALLLKLGNEDEKVWRPAFEELEYFDPRLAIDLETLMDRYKETRTRQRMVEVMSGNEAGWLRGQEVHFGKTREGMVYFSTLKSFWRADHKIEDINRNGHNPKKKWTRIVCAIVLLEQIGTPDAVAILRDMAAGHPDAQPTRMAKDAIVRLGR